MLSMRVRERERQTDRQIDRDTETCVSLTVVPSPDLEVVQGIHSPQVYLPPVVRIVIFSVDTVGTVVGPVCVVRCKTGRVGGVVIRVEWKIYTTVAVGLP